MWYAVEQVTVLLRRARRGLRKKEKKIVGETGLAVPNLTGRAGKEKAEGSQSFRIVAKVASPSEMY